MKIEAVDFYYLSMPEIADIGDVPLGRSGAGDRVVAIYQHAARLADRIRPEARPGAVRGAEIIGDAGDADRRRGIALRNPEKARPHCKGRCVAHAVNMGRQAPS